MDFSECICFTWDGRRPYFGIWHFGKRHFSTDIHHRDFAAWGYFGTRTFQYGYFFGSMDVLAQGTHVVYAKMSMCRNILVPKCPSAVISLYRNVHVAEIYSYWNVVVPKCPRAEKSPWWNVHAKMSLAKMIGDKISPRLTWNCISVLYRSRTHNVYDCIIRLLKTQQQLRHRFQSHFRAGGAYRDSGEFGSTFFQSEGDDLCS